MLKSFKYFGIILIVFFLLFSLSTMSLAASDIDMNLEDNSTADNEIVIEENGTYSEEETENTTETTSTDNTTTDATSDATVSATSVSATTDDGLSFTNILNILLITVGVVLILLAIAILIRLK